MSFSVALFMDEFVIFCRYNRTAHFSKFFLLHWSHFPTSYTEMDSIPEEVKGEKYATNRVQIKHKAYKYNSSK